MMTQRWKTSERKCACVNSGAPRTFLGVLGVRTKSKNARDRLHAEAGEQECEAFDAALETWLNQIDKKQTGSADCAEPVYWAAKARAPRAVAPATFE
jgi:hypothetical protein